MLFSQKQNLSSSDLTYTFENLKPDDIYTIDIYSTIINHKEEVEESDQVKVFAIVGDLPSSPGKCNTYFVFQPTAQAE